MLFHFEPCRCFIYQRQSAIVCSSLLWSKGGKGSMGCLRLGPSLCGDAERKAGFEESEMLCFIFIFSNVSKPGREVLVNTVGSC